MHICRKAAEFNQTLDLLRVPLRARIALLILDRIDGDIAVVSEAHLGGIVAVGFEVLAELKRSRSVRMWYMRCWY